ncbi:MAG: hypothetical protein ACFFD4_15295 [Candidatus Odinarchaeota archaeon]
MVKEVIETRTARIWLDEDGIVHYVSLAGAEMKLEDAQETIEIIAKIAAGQKIPVLIDNKLIKSAAREARSYFSGKEAEKVTLATAIITGFPLSKMIANLYFRASKPPFPVKLFTSEDRAIEWLRGFLE